MTVDDLLAVKWVKQPALSPDGKRVAFVVSTADKARNKRRSSIYLYDLRGGRLRRLTNAAAGSSHSPVFAPDSRTVAFISSRGKGKPQIWTIRVDGGEACRLTRLATGAGGPLVYSPDGKLIAFTASVFPGCRDDACNRKKLDAKKRSKVKARLFDRLMIRHWNEWLDERRTHVLVAPASGKGKTRDLTPGPHHAPPLALGGHLDVVFSPDGKTLAFASNTDPSPATSTNNDIFEVAVAGGRPRRVSSSKGNDTDPAYSPDGRWLAFLSMARAGYESDRPRVMVRDRRSGKTEEWSKGYDGRPLQLVWGPGSKVLYFNAPDRGRLEIFAASATGVRRVTRGRYARDLSVTPEGRLVYTDEAADRPAELAVEGSDGKGYRRLTHLNDWLRRKLGWLGAEHLWFKGAGGEKVHAILIKPPGFRGGRRYPAMVMIHGGPQGMTGDSFHPRWNLQMFASPGYVIFGINFHGSTGFGQRFQDSIRGDWGGKPYRDIVEGTEHLARLPFVRAKKICAAGASYGGYMVNWVATQTRRFNCLISHAGLFNMESKYGSTEELWFPEWDWRGTPWTQRALYRRFSPHSHAEKIRTPTLVIHGQRDYRVPVEQGFQMFTVLQRQGIPSRLLYFPDEDHFVAKPQNVQLWWDTMLDWLGRYLR
jgi:dipeptidyl aminopeptidase/acylaminoacyl peptidase